MDAQRKKELTEQYKNRKTKGVVYSQLVAS